MSASMDKDPAEHGESAQGVLASWLDDYSAGRCELEDMEEAFRSVCRSNPEAPWDALALLDQYQRRGRIDPALARGLKSEIAQLVFGRANQAGGGARDSAEEPEEDATEEEQEPIDKRASDQESSRQEPQRPEPQELQRPESQRPEPPRQEAPVPTRERESARPEPWSRADRGAGAREPGSKSRPAQPVRVAAPVTELPSARREVAQDVLRQRYELVGVLGRTNTGTVYKAIDRHRTHLPEPSRQVAVKVLDHSYYDRPPALAELERRFHQAQSLAHPNLVHVFDLDRDGETYFLVMELLDGQPLATILRQLKGRQLPRDRALGIVAAVGAALAHAHRRDVAHGDLRPRNVMITASGEVKVLDLGFAGRGSEPWVSDGESGPLAPETDAPAYASVERVEGAPPQPEDDVYALACIAYELLAGRHPFGGRSGALARAHGRRPQRIPGLNSRSWHALQRALGWTRSDRRIEVGELLAALGAAEVPPRLLMPHELLRAAAEEGERASRWKWVAVIAVIAVAAVAGFAYDRIRDTIASLPAIVDSELPGVAQPPQEAEVAPEEELPRVQPAPADPAADTAPPQAEAQPTEQAPSPAEPVAEPVPRADEGDIAPSEPEPPAAVPPTVEFERDTYVVRESDGAVRLTITRRGSTQDAVAFGWSLHGGSAEPGRDYADIGPGTERIPAGARTVILALPLVSDAVAEDTENFTVELYQLDGGPQVGALARATVIIVDDD